MDEVNSYFEGWVPDVEPEEPSDPSVVQIVYGQDRRGVQDCLSFQFHWFV
jgi:hypothetical protein